MTPEELDALVAAAWQKGRDDAARVAYSERDFWFKRDSPQRVDCAQWVASRIRDLTPPTPEQLKEIR